MGVDLALFLVDDMLVKTDRASMAHSLEARVPLLDTVVAELALALPTRMKVRGLAKKRLLRRAVAPLLPREIIEGKKRGFSPPIGNWLRNELQPIARDVLSRGRRRAAGLLPAGRRHAADRRPRRAERRQQPQDLGAARRSRSGSTATRAGMSTPEHESAPAAALATEV